jgi:hypothetical protein
MEELAKEVLSNFKMEDRPSRFVLVSEGRNYNDPLYTFMRPTFTKVLKTTAPVEKGSICFKVSFLDNHINMSSTDPEWDWEHLEYDGNDCDGVVGFIDGFLASRKNGNRVVQSSEYRNRSYHLGLIRLEEVDQRLGKKFACWNLSRNADQATTRLPTIRGAVKALLAKIMHNCGE